MSVDVVIINYRTHIETSKAVKSLYKFCDFNRIVIVDNSDNFCHWHNLVTELLPAGTDPKKSKHISPDSKLQLIRAKQNLGFGAGCNFAVRNCGVDADFIWFLNSDCTLLEDALTPLIKGMMNDEYVALSSFTYYDCGDLKYNKLQVWTVKNYCGWFRNVSSGFRLALINGYGIVDSFNCYGASFLVRRREFNRVGGFDENYFMYLEESDLVYRLKEFYGKKSGFVAESRVLHQQGASSNNNYNKERRVLENYLYFVKKNFVGVERLLGLCFYGCKLLLMTIRKLSKS